MHNLKELIIWQKSMLLSKMVYSISSDLPSNEKFGLTSQIKRSAISIASNIAEVAGRNSDAEFVRFLGIANGSAYELQTQLILIQELELLKDSKIIDILSLLDEVIRINVTLQNKFKPIDV